MTPKSPATLLAAAGLCLAAATAASAQSADTPWPSQMGPQWMMTPMGPGWVAPDGPSGWMMWSPQATRPGGMGGAFYRFRVIDVDGDGVVSDAEAAANHEEAFVAMDVDEDGDLTEAEYLAASFGPGPMGWGPRHAQVQERKQAAFAEMDADGSGAVSQREWMTLGEQRFAAADQDNDGAVTVWEFRSLRRF